MSGYLNYLHQLLQILPGDILFGAREETIVSCEEVV